MNGPGEASLHPLLLLPARASQAVGSIERVVQSPCQIRSPDLLSRRHHYRSGNFCQTGSGRVISRSNPHQSVVDFVAEDQGRSEGSGPCHGGRDPDSRWPLDGRANGTRRFIRTTARTGLRASSLASPSREWTEHESRRTRRCGNASRGGDHRAPMRNVKRQAP